MDQQLISIGLCGVAAGVMAQSLGKLDGQASLSIAVGVVGLMWFLKSLSGGNQQQQKVEKPERSSRQRKPVSESETEEEEPPPKPVKKAAKKVKVVEREHEPEPEVSEPEPEPAEKKKKKKAKKEKKEEPAAPAPAPAATPVPKKKEAPEPEPEPAPQPKKAASAPAAAPKPAVAAAVPAKPAPKAAAAPAPEVKATATAVEPEKLSKKAKKAKKKQKEEAVVGFETAVEEAAPEDEGWTTVPSTKPVKTEELARFGNDPNISKQEVSVPVDSHAVIMGPQGSTLAALEKATDTLITLPPMNNKTREATSKWILIKGRAENIEKAKKGIEELLAKGYSRFTHPNQTDSTVTVPVDKRPAVIGPKGKHIQDLVAATGAKITMADKKSNEEEVKILGDKEAVRRAKKYILELVADGFCEVTHPGWIKDEVDVSMSKIGRLIGKKASKIRAIQDETGTKISTPDKDDSEDGNGKVIIAGPEQGVHKARYRVLEAMQDDPEDVVTDEVDPDWAIAPDDSFFAW